MKTFTKEYIKKYYLEHKNAIDQYCEQNKYLMLEYNDNKLAITEAVLLYFYN